MIRLSDIAKLRRGVQKLALTSALAALMLCGTHIIGGTNSAAGVKGNEASLFGNYLSGRLAHSLRDTDIAARYYSKALELDPKNEAILEQAFLLEASAGNWSRVDKLVKSLVKKEPNHRIARLYLGVKAVKEKRFKSAEQHFKKIGKGPIVELTATLARGWINLALKQPDQGLKLLKTPSQAEWERFYKRYHRALIASLSKKNTLAEAEFKKIFEADPRALRVALSYTRHAAYNKNVARAKEVIDAHLRQTSGHPNSKALQKEIEGGAKISLLVGNPQDGLAEVFYGLGDALTGEGGVDLGTIYLQLALFLKPEFPLAHASLASVFENMKKYERSLLSYNHIGPQAPIWSRVQIRKAFNLNSLKRVDEAKQILDQLAAKEPENIRPLDALGNILRSHKRYKEALEYYDRAIALIKKPTLRHWSHFYSRGVSYERIKRWDKAEVDLKKALELNPNQPLILNYLGYSWVDQSKNLKQAMELIRKAVKLKPNDGYFVDSLGWAHYRLAKYEEAVKYLERAVELRPDDPVINDHLGDAYWRAGRRNEAKFQWFQAKSLNPDKETLEKIRHKLKHGLPQKRQAKAVIQ